MTATEVPELGRGLPGWTLRGLIAATGAGMVAVLAAAGIGGAALGLLGIAALLSVILPASPAPTLMLVLTAMSVVATGADPFAASVLVMIPLVHLLHVTCAIAGLLPASSRVHLAALKAPAVRFLAIQAGVFALAGVTAMAPTGRVPAALELAAFIAVVAVAGLLFRLHRPR